MALDMISSERVVETPPTRSRPNAFMTPPASGCVMPTSWNIGDPGCQGERDVRESLGKPLNTQCPMSDVLDGSLVWLLRCWGKSSSPARDSHPSGFASAKGLTNHNSGSLSVGLFLQIFEVLLPRGETRTKNPFLAFTHQH